MTVLSAMASGCDPVDHVRTQLPYAALAGAGAIGALLLVGVGTPWWLTWLPAPALVVGWMLVLARAPEGAAGGAGGSERGTVEPAAQQ